MPDNNGAEVPGARSDNSSGRDGIASTSEEGSVEEKTSSDSDEQAELDRRGPSALGAALVGRWALVYLQMPNGSLEDRLACADNTPPLTANMRLRVALGVARGLAFVHRQGVTHRDVKPGVS